MARTKKSSKEKRTAFSAVAKRMKSWKPASEVLTMVRAVPTIFPQLNVATRIGGWPLQRVAVIHGPSSHGKTTFVHGLGMSFLERGHFYGYVDAEYTTPEDWLTTLMQQWAGSDGFVAIRPTSYEETVDAVRSLVETVAEARAKKEIPSDTSALIVVDSIRKLVPQRLREAIEKSGAEAEKGSIDGMSGRAAQYKAALNAAWLDELTPLLYHTNTTLVFIGRESENQQKTQYDLDYKLTGGKALFFDSSVVGRVTRASWVRKGKDGPILGERHRLRIHKTKVAGKDDKVVDCFFHTSNGVLVPAGFDRARDVIEMGTECGLIAKRGAWLDSTLTGETWNGVNAAVKALTADASSLSELALRCEEHYRPHEEEKEAPGDA